MNCDNYQQNRSSYEHNRNGGQARDSRPNNRDNNRYSGQGGRQLNDRKSNQPTPEKLFADVKRTFSESEFKKDWITAEADSELPIFADKMGKEMATGGLTNSKIRSIYGEIKRIQMGRFENNKAAFYLLRPKVAYALGRDPKNRGLMLFKLVFDKASESVSDEISYKNFCNLIEAILAYHKAYGGKD